jgi:hypothetical protein
VESLSPACLLVLAEIISSALKIKAMFLRNVSPSQQTTRRHIPEDDTLHNHRCGNLKSYISVSYLCYSHGCHNKRIISLNSINWLVFIVVKQRASCEAETEFLNVI